MAGFLVLDWWRKRKTIWYWVCVSKQGGVVVPHARLLASYGRILVLLGYCVYKHLEDQNKQLLDEILRGRRS